MPPSQLLPNEEIIKEQQKQHSSKNQASTKPQTNKGKKRKLIPPNQVSLENMMKRQRKIGVRKPEPELPDVIKALAQQIQNNNKQQIHHNITQLGRKAEKLISKNDPLRGNLQQIMKQIKSAET